MNLVWSAVMLVGMGLLVINNVDLVVNSLLNGGSKAITLSLKLWGIYTLWLGILKIVEETGLDKKLSKLLSPLIKWIFGEVDDYTKNQIAVNITSNLFGMGNASTPSGMNAIAGLDKGSKYATSAMIMIVVINSTSMQLVPTTIIGLRATAGSVNSTDIIIPTLIATIITTLVGVILVKIFSKIFKDKE
jgi:spore maturation protein A